MSVGLALSGGGSRAAAFHSGTLKGLSEAGLLDSVEVVSTVSGGSVFGAAWMAAVAKGQTLDLFLSDLRGELSQGFVKRAFGPRLLLTAWPGYTRTNLLAAVFDKALLNRMALADLPDKPRLVMNVTVMNHGQVGKFAKEGFKTIGLIPPESKAFSEWIALPKYKVALAAAASAAFPVGLPPVYLKRGKHVPADWGNTETLRQQTLFALTDGGVLENLGLQTLLNPMSEFTTWNMVCSDAGATEAVWAPGGAKNRMRGLFMGAVSAPVLERVGVLMNDKEDRHMRHHAIDEVEKSRLVGALHRQEAAESEEMRGYLSEHPDMPERRLLMVRLSQNWTHFLSRLPHWRLRGLRDEYQRRTRTLAPPLPEGDDLTTREEFLSHVGVDLSAAKSIYHSMGGDSKVADVNRIATSFGPLTVPEMDALHDHARWQVHALKAVYWEED